MALTLSPDNTKRLEASIRRYFGEHLDEDIGELKAAMLVDYRTPAARGARWRRADSRIPTRGPTPSP